MLMIAVFAAFGLSTAARADSGTVRISVVKGGWALRAAAGL
jgi:hypothetical protein